MSTPSGASRHPTQVPAAVASTPAGEEVDQLTEATVVGRAADGDLAAFEQLVHRYQPRLNSLARQMLHDAGEAEDAVQDSMLQIWRKLPTLTDPAAFPGWAYQVTTRRCLDLMRRHTRRRTDATLAEDLEQVADAESAGPGAQTQHRARRDALDAGLLALPPEQRVCWVLYELHDFSYGEIATTVVLPVSTVRGRIARARENLMKAMEGWR